MIGKSGLSLIKEAEGFSAKPYQDSGGVWTQGFGHTRGVTADTHFITEGAAEELLKEDLRFAERSVDTFVKVPLTENQRDALISLCFNCGSAPLLGTLGKLLNNRDYIGAAEEILVWNHVKGKVIPGLTKRRQRERDLFLT